MQPASTRGGARGAAHAGRRTRGTVRESTGKTGLVERGLALNQPLMPVARARRARSNKRTRDRSPGWFVKHELDKVRYV